MVCSTRQTLRYWPDGWMDEGTVYLLVTLLAPLILEVLVLLTHTAMSSLRASFPGARRGAPFRGLWKEIVY